MYQKIQRRKYFSPINNLTLFSKALFYHRSKKLSMTCLKNSKEDLGLVIRKKELCKILQVTKVCSNTCLALLLLQSKQAVYDTYINKPISEKYIALLPKEKKTIAMKPSSTSLAKNQLFMELLNNE